MSLKMRIKESEEKNSPYKRKGSQLLATVLAAIIFLGVLYYANYDRPVYQAGNTTGTTYEIGKVTGILEDKHTVDEEIGGIWRGSMELQVKILTGQYKGETTNITNYFSSLYNVRVRQGDKVSIRIDRNGSGEYQASIYNYYRVPQISASVIVFLVLLIAIGGKKGAKSAIGLIFTMICVIGILLPLTLKGYSALMITLVLILICNLVSFILIDGIQAKTIVAAIGSICGVLAGAGFAIFAQKIMSVTTLQMEEAETLLLVMTNTKLEIKDLFLCGILIACMGAVMDVAMSIASSIAEIHTVNPQMKMWDLFRSGMNIGQDAMGTMSNTLILAFTGNSLNMMLMIYSFGIGFQQLMNTDFVAIEIIRSIAGSIGIICTVPIVALIAAFVFGGERKKTGVFQK